VPPCSLLEHARRSSFGRRHTKLQPPPVPLALMHAAAFPAPHHNRPCRRLAEARRRGCGNVTAACDCGLLDAVSSAGRAQYQIAGWATGQALFCSSEPPDMPLTSSVVECLASCLDVLTTVNGRGLCSATISSAAEAPTSYGMRPIAQPPRASRGICQMPSANAFSALHLPESLTQELTD
jgi:hypothetical protein